MLSENHSTIKTHPRVEEKEELVKKTKYNFLWQILTEFVVVFILIASGLIIEAFNRQLLFLVDGTLNTVMLAFIVQQTLPTAFISVIFYKFMKTSYFGIVMSLSRRLAEKEEDRVLTTLFDIFIILAVLLPTMFVRPIIHTTYLESDITGFTYNYAQYDALFSVLLLSIVALPLTYLLHKRKDDLLRWLKIWGVVIIIGIVGYLNSFGFGNFYTRILESSASWVKKDWSEQSNLAHKALLDAETDDEKATAYFWLGVAENRKGNYEEAVKYQLKALSLAPDYAAAHSSLANAYTLLGEHQKSFEHAKKCIGSDPGYAWCYQAMSNHYWTIGEEEQALQYAKKATTFDPADRELAEIYQYVLDNMK